MISNEQLIEWERLANEATEGPWTTPKDILTGAHYKVKTQADVSHYRTRDICVMPLACPNDCIDNGYDARFIAATREAVPTLITEVRTLEASRNKKTEKLNELIAMVDYLTQVLASKHKCPVNIECPQRTSDYIIQSECAKCWRIEAKKATEN